MGLEQPDFEASRKKSDEFFEKQAEERNKLSDLSGGEKVSGLDMAREEAEIVNNLIERELELAEKDNALADEEYASKFLAIAEVHPNLAGYSREKIRALVKNRLAELSRLRDERGLPEKKKE